MPKIVPVVKNTGLATELVLLYCFPFFVAYFLHILSLDCFFFFSLFFVLLSLTHISLCYFLSAHQLWPIYSSSVFGGKTKSSFTCNNWVVSYPSILTLRRNAFHRWWFMSSWLEAAAVTPFTSPLVPWGASLQSGKPWAAWKLINHNKAGRFPCILSGTVLE